MDVPVPPYWLYDLYYCVEDEQHDGAIDMIYEHFEDALHRSLDEVDTVLAMFDVTKVSAAEIVAVLIATLSAKNRLKNRQSFIERSLSVLRKEDDSVEDILHGLI